MAIINNSNKFVFVHVPKAAGTSVTHALSKYTNYCDLEIGGTVFGEQIQEPYFRRFGISKHSPAARLRTCLGEIEWGRYYSFSFVRNPYTRFLSTFKFLKEWEGVSEQYRSYLEGFDGVDEFVQRGNWAEHLGPDQIFRPQAFWLTDREPPHSVLVDFVGKLESIDSDLNKILQKVDPNFEPEVDKLNVKALNQSSNTNEVGSLSRKSLDLINHFYARDFKLFGYEVI